MKKTILALGAVPEDAVSILQEAYYAEGVYHTYVVYFDETTKVRNRNGDGFLTRLIQAMKKTGIDTGYSEDEFTGEEGFDEVQSIVDYLSYLLAKVLFLDRGIKSFDSVIYAESESYDQAYLDLETSYYVDSDYAPAEMSGWEYLLRCLAKPKSIYVVRKDSMGRYWLYGTGELGSALPRL